MARIRTFVAIDIDQSLRDACERITKRLAADVDARWVAPENLHITIKFVGDVEDRELHDVCQVVKAAARQVEPFLIGCRGVGAFPSIDRPNTVWIGAESIEGQLTSLHSLIDKGLCQTLGVPMENRPFKGHLTLGRTHGKRSKDGSLTEALESLSTEDFGSIRVGEVVVYSSELRRIGPEYTVVGRCPLG